LHLFKFKLVKQKAPESYQQEDDIESANRPIFPSHSLTLLLEHSRLYSLNRQKKGLQLQSKVLGHDQFGERIQLVFLTIPMVDKTSWP
jgi:hypothetical protein